jgi:hypothetical protein
VRCQFVAESLGFGFPGEVKCVADALLPGQTAAILDMMQSPIRKKHCAELLRIPKVDGHGQSRN